VCLCSLHGCGFFEDDDATPGGSYDVDDFTQSDYETKTQVTITAGSGNSNAGKEPVRYANAVDVIKKVIDDVDKNVAQLAPQVAQTIGKIQQHVAVEKRVAPVNLVNNNAVVKQRPAVEKTGAKFGNMAVLAPLAPLILSLGLFYSSLSTGCLAMGYMHWAVSAVSVAIVFYGAYTFKTGEKVSGVKIIAAGSALAFATSLVAAYSVGNADNWLSSPEIRQLLVIVPSVIICAFSWQHGITFFFASLMTLLNAAAVAGLKSEYGITAFAVVYAFSFYFCAIWQIPLLYQRRTQQNPQSRHPVNLRRSPRGRFSFRRHQIVR
jgi:hypothetical protein